jgi:hypothetical protein
VRPQPAARGPARIPIVLFVLILVAAGVVIDQSSSAPSPTRVVVASAVDGPLVPPKSAVSAAWYCAEGTSSDGGRADETIVIGNLAKHDISATVTVMAGADKQPRAEELTITALGQERIPVSDIMSTDEPGVLVEVQGGQAVVEHVLKGNDDVAVGPCARQPSGHWYFAEGSTERGAQEWLALFNPFGDDAIVDITFLTSSGFESPGALQGFVVPRHSRVSVPVHEHALREGRVAIAVQARSGRVVAERSLIFDGTETPKGMAVSLGLTGAAKRWRFPIGGIAPGSKQSLSIANFTLNPTSATIDVKLEGEASLEAQSVDVPARSVTRVDLSERVPDGVQFSVVVRTRGDDPVVVESFASRASPATTVGVSVTSGSVTTARRWAFAVGRLDTDSEGIDGDTTLVALNVSGRPLTIELLAYTQGDPQSPKSAPARAVPAGKRGVFSLRQIGIGPEQVLIVQADGPIVVARQVVGGGISLSPGVPDPS